MNRNKQDIRDHLTEPDNLISVFSKFILYFHHGIHWETKQGMNASTECQLTIYDIISSITQL